MFCPSGPAFFLWWRSWYGSGSEFLFLWLSWYGFGSDFHFVWRSWYGSDSGFIFWCRFSPDRDSDATFRFNGDPDTDPDPTFHFDDDWSRKYAYCSANLCLNLGFYQDFKNSESSHRKKFRIRSDPEWFERSNPEYHVWKLIIYCFRSCYLFVKS